MRFYFDLLEDGGINEDAEGQELPDEGAALAAAKEAAAEIATELMPRGDVEKVVVWLKDEDKQLVATVTISLQVSTEE